MKTKRLKTYSLETHHRQFCDNCKTIKPVNFVTYTGSKINYDKIDMIFLHVNLICQGCGTNKDIIEYKTPKKKTKNHL